MGCLVLVLLLIAFGYGGLWLLYYFAIGSAKITVTIVNRSNAPIRSARVWVAGRRTLLDLGDIRSGGQITRSTRFDHDYGPGHLDLTHGPGTLDEQLGYMLLTDNGPFEYTYTFYNDHIHVEGFAGSKGDYAYDISLTPTTAPPTANAPRSR
jgi:hypothetical protein